MAKAEYEHHQPQAGAEWSYDLVQAQSSVQRLVDRLYEVHPWHDGLLLEDVELDAHSANDIEHGLGRKLRGYFFVRRPALRCGFRVEMNSDDTGAAVNTTWSNVVHDTEVYDLGDNISSGLFTAPFAGEYTFDATTRIVRLQDGDRGQIRLGGSSVHRWGDAIKFGGALNPNLRVSAASLRLDKDDTVKVQVEHNTGSNEDISGSPSATWFEGRAIDTLGERQDELSDDDKTKFLRLYSSCDRKDDLAVSLVVF